MKITFKSVLIGLIFSIVAFFSVWTTVTLWLTGQINNNPIAIASNIIYMMIPLLFVTVAGMILSRMPRHAVGWLMLLLGILVSLTGTAQLVVSQFPQLPANPPFILIAAVWLSNIIWLHLIIIIFLIVLVFPTGKPPSPGWLWLLRYGYFLLLFYLILSFFYPQYEYFERGWILQNPIGISALTSFGTSIAPLIMAIILVVPSFLSLIIRYLKAAYVERQQMKWFLFACVLFILIIFSTSMIFPGTDWGDMDETARELSSLLIGLGIIIFPITMGIAILRYKLFDIDLIIRKTLTYAVVTGLLGLIYFGSVITLQAIIDRTMSQQSPLIIVLSTLLIAALFRPLHNRIQDIIDRRFYRRKYDAQQILAHFAKVAQDETDKETLTAEMEHVIQESIQPEEMSIWLKREH